MLEIFDAKFIFSIALLIFLPLSRAYYDALKLARLPREQHIMLRAASFTASVLAIYLSFSLIAQINENSLTAFDIIFVFILFILGVLIQKKFPNLFLKTLLKSKY
jgi:hypothetical protein